MGVWLASNSLGHRQNFALVNSACETMTKSFFCAPPLNQDFSTHRDWPVKKCHFWFANQVKIWYLTESFGSPEQGHTASQSYSLGLNQSVTQVKHQTLNVRNQTVKIYYLNFKSFNLKWPRCNRNMEQNFVIIVILFLRLSKCWWKRWSSGTVCLICKLIFVVAGCSNLFQQRQYYNGYIN